MNCPQCTDEMVKTSISRHHDEYHYCRTCKKELKEMPVGINNGYWSGGLTEQLLDVSGLKTPNPLLPKGSTPWGGAPYPMPLMPPITNSPPTAGITNVPPVQAGQSILNNQVAPKATLRMKNTVRAQEPCGYYAPTNEDTHYVGSGGYDKYCTCGLYDRNGGPGRQVSAPVNNASGVPSPQQQPMNPPTVPVRMSFTVKTSMPCGYDPFTHEEIHYVFAGWPKTQFYRYCTCGMFDEYGNKP